MANPDLHFFPQDPSYKPGDGGPSSHAKLAVQTVATAWVKVKADPRCGTIQIARSEFNPALHEEVKGHVPEAPAKAPPEPPQDDARAELASLTLDQLRALPEFAAVPADKGPLRTKDQIINAILEARVG